jgi:NADPH-dependent curcumin reductase CurA
MFFDHLETIMKGIEDLSQWIGDKQIEVLEDIQVGLENAPRTMRRLFEGKNLGKQILKIH